MRKGFVLGQTGQTHLFSFQGAVSVISLFRLGSRANCPFRLGTSWPHQGKRPALCPEQVLWDEEEGFLCLNLGGSQQITDELMNAISRKVKGVWPVKKKTSQHCYS